MEGELSATKDDKFALQNKLTSIEQRIYSLLRHKGKIFNGILLFLADFIWKPARAARFHLKFAFSSLSVFIEVGSVRITKEKCLKRFYF